MTLFQSILLGVVQGLSEFLPISSSAHLVIIPYLLKWQIPPEQAFVFDVLVQVATLMAVVTYFWKDLVQISKAFVQGILHKSPFINANARFGWLLLLATIPAGLLGLAIKDAVKSAFGNPVVAALFLLVTVVLLVIAERVGKRLRGNENLNWLDALWIGAFQAIAIFPGISRSGSTIAGGMTRDLQRPVSARFAFLMSIPIMLAAGASATVDLFHFPNMGAVLPVFIPGFIVAAIVGYFSIRWLLGFLIRHTLYDFAIYCVILSFITLVTALIRR